MHALGGQRAILARAWLKSGKSHSVHALREKLERAFDRLAMNGAAFVLRLSKDFSEIANYFSAYLVS